MPSSPWKRTAIPCFSFAQFAFDTTSQLLLKMESKYEIPINFLTCVNTEVFCIMKRACVKLHTSVDQQNIIFINWPMDHVRVLLSRVQMLIKPFTAIFKGLGKQQRERTEHDQAHKNKCFICIVKKTETGDKRFMLKRKDQISQTKDILWSRQRLGHTQWIFFFFLALPVGWILHVCKEGTSSSPPMAAFQFLPS